MSIKRSISPIQSSPGSTNSSQRKGWLQQRCHIKAPQSKISSLGHLSLITGTGPFLFPLPSIYAYSAHVNVSTLTRNIRFVAESLAKYIYGLHERDVEVFGGSLGLSNHFVSSWLQALTDNPRAEMFGIDSNLLGGLERVHYPYHSLLGSGGWGVVLFINSLQRTTLTSSSKGA